MGRQPGCGKRKPNNYQASGTGRVETHLNFIKPFKGEADTYIILAGGSNATKVTWGFDTKYSYPMNVMQLFFDMDEMMGKQYDKGLSKLKTISESN